MQWIHKVALVCLLCWKLISFSPGENPPQNDLQSATVELPEVPVPVFHGPRFGAALVGQPRVGHGEHAGRRQQGPRQWEVSGLWKGLLKFSRTFSCCKLKSDSILVNQVYQWKLLNHVAKDHGKTLKPAHLSYKCTVCTATFGQYKLFENHVYTAHSGVAKKGDKAKQVQRNHISQN